MSALNHAHARKEMAGPRVNLPDSMVKYGIINYAAAAVTQSNCWVIGVAAVTMFGWFGRNVSVVNVPA